MMADKTKKLDLCPCGKALKDCDCYDSKKEEFQGCGNCSCGHSG